LIVVGEGDCKYVIDSYKMGNVSRFFNHSCNPNMATYSVFIDTDDPYRHELALFTTRVIAAGEELTFDYGGFNRTGTTEVMGNQQYSTCFCGAPNCRKVLPIPL
jgi:[histone H3]-lysine9 N-trimethyltransferase SUV39H